jgi:hypothetical protein
VHLQFVQQLGLRSRRLSLGGGSNLRFGGSAQR